ncbi:carbohydrate kinase family protein [Rugosimonospora acidiphila]|uniref:carbohydrate kinase family protein n=1 Tax=Rugosimonospora acidiphila TaxID=556531 RepID=UPI0031EB2D65
MSHELRPEVVVLGEALIDLVDGGDSPYQAHAGGGPYNVAIGLARLGVRTGLLARLSTDPFGMLLREHAERSHVDLSAAVVTDQPTTVALVRLRDGAATYHFQVDGTANFGWTDAELDAVAVGHSIVHFGSLVSWTPPGSGPVHRFVARLRDRGDVLVSYDPNVRPLLQSDPDRARADVESAVGVAHLVKASADDLAWLYPGAAAADVAARWLAAGPALVVITLADRGSVAFRPTGAPVARPIRPGPAVVDTIGAGDAFISGLLRGLCRRGVAGPADLPGIAGSADTIGALLDEASTVAAVACSRPGANPPWRDEVGFDRTGG